jgi:hypothetical protein
VALAREGKTLRTIDPVQHPATQRMAERWATPGGKDHYRRRQFIPEPVFGGIKQAIGSRRFSVRAREAVTGEWNRVRLALNLRRMQRLGCCRRNRPGAQCATPCMQAPDPLQSGSCTAGSRLMIASRRWRACIKIG